MTAEFRSRNLQETTETLLEEGLRARGHQVLTDQHRYWNKILDPDVVHIHHLANSCPQFALRRQFPLVFTRHATKELSPSHSLVNRLMQRRADAHVALSDAEATALTSRVGTNKVKRIYNGVDGESFTPPTIGRAIPEQGEPWRMLYVGQLIELKRVHLAIEAIASMRSRGLACTLSVVSQRDTLRSQLLEYAHAAGVSDSIHWLGPRPKEQVASLMRQSHLLLVPSRTEALSTVVIEACMSGLPVAAFNVGGMAEQLPESVPILKAEEAEHFGSLVASMIGNYAYFAALFADHAGIVRQRFSIDVMVEEHLKLYNEVLRK